MLASSRAATSNLYDLANLVHWTYAELAKRVCEYEDATVGLTPCSLAVDSKMLLPEIFK